MKQKLFILLILISALLAGRHLFRAGLFTMHDDLQVGRLFQMRQCIQDRQIPCRWVPDMGYGYGYPLFNFYPPLPFYAGYVFDALGFSLIASTKILFLIGIIGGGLFMYYLGEKLWGEWAGLISGIFYIWAPYRAVNIFVRGALNEFWAMMFFPLIIYAITQVIEHGKKYLPLLTVSYAGLLLSHNGMSMLFTLLMVIWAFGYLIIKRKDFKKSLGHLTLAGLWAGGLAAFFIFPALLEKRHVHVETMLMGYFNYLAHFISLGQMFIERSWGYGASVWGPEDDMSFQLGIAHWLSVLPVLGWGLIKIKQIKRKTLYTILFFFIVFLGSIFLAHSRSTLIWKRLGFLEFIQFPWRFLAISTFSLSVLAGGLAKIFKKNKYLILIILALVAGLNFSYFVPDKVIVSTDIEKIFSEEGWKSLQTDAIFDYLPKSADMPPTEPAVETPTTDGEREIEIISYEQGSDWYQTEVEADERLALIFPIFNFPGWRAWVNEQPAEVATDADLGRIIIEIPPGRQEIFLKLTDTPVRQWSNLISLLSGVTLVVVLTHRRRQWLSIK